MSRNKSKEFWIEVIHYFIKQEEIDMKAISIKFGITPSGIRYRLNDIIGKVGTCDLRNYVDNLPEERFSAKMWNIHQQIKKEREAEKTKKNKAYQKKEIIIENGIEKLYQETIKRIKKGEPFYFDSIDKIIYANKYKIVILDPRTSITEYVLKEIYEYKYAEMLTFKLLTGKLHPSLDKREKLETEEDIQMIVKKYINKNKYIFCTTKKFKKEKEIYQKNNLNTKKVGINFIEYIANEKARIRNF